MNYQVWAVSVGETGEVMQHDFSVTADSIDEAANKIANDIAADNEGHEIITMTLRRG